MGNNLKYIKDLTEEEFDELLSMYGFDYDEPNEDCPVVSDDLDIWEYQDLQYQIKRNEQLQKFLSTVIDLDKERKNHQEFMKNYMGEYAGFYDWDIKRKINLLIANELKTPTDKDYINHLYKLFFELKTATPETKSNIQNEIEEAYFKKMERED